MKLQQKYDLMKKSFNCVEYLEGRTKYLLSKKYGFSSNGCTIRIGTTCKEMTSEQIKIRYEQNFIDNEYMLKKDLVWLI